MLNLNDKLYIKASIYRVLQPTPTTIATSAAITTTTSAETRTITTKKLH